MSLTKIKGNLLRDDAVEKKSAYTVVSNTDSGKVFHTSTTMTFTLPSIAIGNVFTFVYTGLDGAETLTISPAAVDGITYVGSQTDDKDLILTKATAKKGDYVKLASIDQVVAWQVIESRGIWAKQA